MNKLFRRALGFHLLALLTLPLMLTSILNGGHRLWAAEATTQTPATSFSADQLSFFENDVRPLLAEHCYECHSSKSEKIQAGLRVDSRAALLTGGDSGESILPGSADESLFMESVRYESYEMPPKGKLADEDIETFERWINLGAPWPDEAPPEIEGDRDGFDLDERRSEFWVWQPLRQESPPVVKNTAWPRQELDRYILADLESANLAPSEDADRSAILRRLYFDLIGLPPTVDEVAAFLTDTAPGAIERVVDDLLDSPHFGERWGRHWLDLVRYAESRGHEFDDDTPNAFQYRDYVIRAFNADVPYDQFVREHIAGDLIESPRLNPKDGFNESILGTGFWFLGEWVHSPVDIRKDESDRFDNMIDVMSKTFLGVTVACARCHDHKFDAISTADYYSLSGFLQSSDYRQVRFESIEQNRIVAQKLAEIDEGYQQVIADHLQAKNIQLPEVAELSAETQQAVVVDFATLADSDFIQDGFIFGSSPQRLGKPFVETGDVASGDDVTRGDNVTRGDKGPEIRFSTGFAVNDPGWNGLVSVAEERTNNHDKLCKLPRSGRTLRSPTFEVRDGDVRCRARGEGHVVACVDSHRLLAGPLHKQTIVTINPGMDWVKLNLERYIGHRIHLEFTPAENKTLQVTMITQGGSNQALEEIEQRDAATKLAVSKMASQANQELGPTLEKIATAWSDERSNWHGQIMKRSRLAMAMLDGTGEDDHILIRGNSASPGKIEPRHFLTAVSGSDPISVAQGSGRLQLAGEINDPSNPLTSRVIVNRIWHHLLGRGIVPTTDDFGVLGQRPSHPELLDHLATQFRADGQSIKRMIRYIVLSRTYAMSSKSEPEAVEADPKNRLWHHRPPKRLEGEVIRDSLLAISGRLDPKPFGHSVPIHLTSFMEGRGRPKKSGPMDGQGRRSIYVAVRRNFLSPFMLAFDTPSPFSSMGRRNVSNVPAQSLILMNDPFVAELASHWADRAVAMNVRNDEKSPATNTQTGSPTSSLFRERINWLYQSAFAREPTANELTAATGFIEQQRQVRNVDANDKRLWGDLAHAMINTKEFIFLR